MLLSDDSCRAIYGIRRYVRAWDFCRWRRDSGIQGAAASTDNLLKIVGAVLTAAFGGAVVTFMDTFRAPANGQEIDPKSFFMYPVALVVALLWPTLAMCGRGDRSREPSCNGSDRAS